MIMRSILKSVTRLGLTVTLNVLNKLFVFVSEQLYQLERYRLSSVLCETVPGVDTWQPHAQIAK